MVMVNSRPILRHDQCSSPSQRFVRVFIAIEIFWFSYCHVQSFLAPTQSHCRCHPVAHIKRIGVMNATNNGSDRPQNSRNTTSAVTGSSPDPLMILPQLYTYQKPRQKRQSKSSTKRKPRYYWHSSDNLRRELYLFWEELDVDIHPNQPPPIPSEYLLNYFNRNDLRWGLSQMGGKENVAHVLGGAKIIPGRWREAIELEEVKKLLPRMGVENKGSDSKVSTTQQSHGDHYYGGENNTQTHHTNHSSSTIIPAPTSTTKIHAKEFWSKEKAIKELYQYLDSYRKCKRRPAVWMPLLAELSHEGYSKLFNACSRFQELPSSAEDNDEDIHSIAGLVSFREWRFFESQLQLFVELQHYLGLYHNGSDDMFPEPLVVLMHGHKQLYDLIRIHGGKTMLAQKLDMNFAWDINDLPTENTASMNASSPIFSGRSYNTNTKLSWGAFNLGFAIQLLHLIRSQYLTLNPPLSSSHISMPSENDLLGCGHEELAEQVMLYGGYENVARRLGLAYFDCTSQQMEEMRFRRSKLLWKDRHNRLRKDTIKRKRKGLPWNEDLVLKELHAYVKVNMTQRSLPPTVMPRLRHLEEDGRGDLKRAISKFGGIKYITKASGLIPIEVWQQKYDIINK